MAGEAGRDTKSRHNGSVEKKRARDRRAQQNLRDKRTKHTQTLEDKIRLCQALHNTEQFEGLIQACKALQQENEMLRTRQDSIMAMVKQWGSLPPLVSLPNLQQLPEVGAQQHQQGSPEIPSLDTQMPLIAALVDDNTGMFSPDSSQPSQDPVELVHGPDASKALPHQHSANLDYPLAECAEQVKGPIVGSDTDLVEFPSRLNVLGMPIHQPSPISIPAASTAPAIPAGPPPFETSDFPQCPAPVIEVQSQSQDRRAIPSQTPWSDSMLQDLQSFLSSSQAFSFDQHPKNTDRGNAVAESSSAPAIPTLPDMIMRFAPSWAQIPLSVADDEYALYYAPWNINLRVILESPETPSATDLLFGSKQNALANSIENRLKLWKCKDPEKLAIGWLIYSYSKWRFGPTAERFARLPECLQPVPEQLNLPHYSFLDLVLWKKLRANLIKNTHKYNPHEVVAALSHALRVRWSRGETVLERGAEDDLVIRQEFFSKFTCEEGWGLTREFMGRYPELVQGLPADKILYDVDRA
ncbi:hypothetical protein F66182_3381 [Fusarium sp. NRRL 66182]|nr:hypothetical protein F66182_3381 [Fusarium sp. NRRL 66182]